MGAIWTVCLPPRQETPSGTAAPCAGTGCAPAAPGPPLRPRHPCMMILWALDISILMRLPRALMISKKRVMALIPRLRRSTLAPLQCQGWWNNQLDGLQETAIIVHQILEDYIYKTFPKENLLQLLDITNFYFMFLVHILIFFWWGYPTSLTRLVFYEHYSNVCTGGEVLRLFSILIPSCS